MPTELPVATKSIGMGALVEEVAESQRAVIRESGLNLYINVGLYIGPVETDLERVRRILENLLSKYTSTGRI